MNDHEPRGNLLDELAADAPVERMRARLSRLVANPPAVRQRSVPRWAWAAAALVVVGLLLTLRSLAPGPRPSDARVDSALEMLASPSAFERLRGLNAAADLPRSAPSIQPALLGLLEKDASVNVRLSALDILLDRDPSDLDPERLTAALLAEPTAIVQAHLALRMRRSHLLTPREVERVLRRPELQAEARRVLAHREEA